MPPGACFPGQPSLLPEVSSERHSDRLAARAERNGPIASNHVGRSSQQPDGPRPGSPGRFAGRGAGAAGQ